MPKTPTEQERRAAYVQGLNVGINSVRQQLVPLDAGLARRLSKLRGKAALYAAQHVNGQLRASAQLGIKPKLDQIDRIIRYCENTEFR